MISATEKNRPESFPYKEEYVRVNGVDEYLLHYPAAPEAPVFLHIHGGPGAPASVFAYRVEASVSNYSVVYYDQRGAGKTLRRNPLAKLSMELLFFALGGLRSAGLMRKFWNYDLRELGNRYKMPVSYIMGERDRTTPFEIARESYDKLEAPRKSWYYVPDAGHFAMLDNAQAWRDILREIAAEA